MLIVQIRASPKRHTSRQAPLMRPKTALDAVPAGKRDWEQDGRREGGARRTKEAGK